MKTVWILILFVLILGQHQRGFAQEGIQYIKAPYWQVGLTAGQFLPWGIVGVRDNYSWSGMHFSHPTRLGFFEYMGLIGNSKGVTYYNFSVSNRTDYEAFGFVDGFFVLGFSFHRYKRLRTMLREFDFVNETGVHAGFGFSGKIAGPLYARGEMKFFVVPGKAMYVGLGLQYRFGGESNAQSE